MSVKMSLQRAERERQQASERALVAEEKLFQTEERALIAEAQVNELKTILEGRGQERLAVQQQANNDKQQRGWNINHECNLPYLLVKITIKFKQ